MHRQKHSNPQLDRKPRITSQDDFFEDATFPMLWSLEDTTFPMLWSLEDTTFPMLWSLDKLLF